MAEINFRHSGCDRWAIFDKSNIAAYDAKNIHVAECYVAYNGSIHLNRDNETICGEKLKSQGLYHILCSTSPSEIRTRLAELQNSGKEVCGVCTSHFYADEGV